MKYFLKKKPYVLGLLIVALLAAILSVTFLRGKKPAVPVAVFDGLVFELEIAKSDQERSLGLGKRTSLCESCGMLFVFPERGIHPFWMKDMQFPLDILWLDGGKVTSIERNVDPHSQEIFTPKVPGNLVLEVNAGKAETIRIGDSILFR